MTLLNELKQDLKDAITNYQTSRPFKRELREMRAKDVADLIFMIEAADSAVVLKQKVQARLLVLKVGSISVMGWLDLNALRVRLNKIFKDRKYSNLNLLVSENALLQLISHDLQKEVHELRSALETVKIYSPENVDRLTSEVQSLKEQVQNQDMQYKRLQADNASLLNRIGTLETECEAYRMRAEQSERQFNELHTKYLRLLQENKTLKQSLEIEKNKTSVKAVNESRTTSKPFLSRMGFT